MRAIVMVLFGCSALVAGVASAQDTAPAVRATARERATPRVCMTEPAGYYGDSAELIRRRLAWAGWLQWLMVSPLFRGPAGSILLRSEPLWRLLFTRTR